MAHLTLSSPPSGVAFVGEVFRFRPMSIFVSSGYEYENKDMKRIGKMAGCEPHQKSRQVAATQHIALCSG